jgi:hypothetical protein
MTAENRLLAALPREVYEKIAPNLTWIIHEK